MDKCERVSSDFLAIKIASEKRVSLRARRAKLIPTAESHSDTRACGKKSLANGDARFFEPEILQSGFGAIFFVFGLRPANLRKIACKFPKANWSAIFFSDFSLGFRAPQRNSRPKVTLKPLQFHSLEPRLLSRRFSAFCQQTGVYPTPWARGLRDQIQKRAPENPSCIGFTVLRGGLRPWSQTMVSEG